MTMRRGGSIANRRKEREKKRRQQRQDRQRQPQTQPQQAQRASQQPQTQEPEDDTAALPSSPRNQIPVDSRCIRWYDYRPNQRRLYLAYTSGDVYAYSNVPENVMEDAQFGEPFVGSPQGNDYGFSWGRWVNAVIKPNYRHSRIYTAAR